MTLYDYITKQKGITHETIAAQAASLGVSIGTLKKVQAGEPVSPRVFRILATAIDEAPAALAARFPQATGSLHRRKETLTHVLDQNAEQVATRIISAIDAMNTKTIVALTALAEAVKNLALKYDDYDDSDAADLE